VPARSQGKFEARTPRFTKEFAYIGFTTNGGEVRGGAVRKAAIDRVLHSTMNERSVSDSDCSVRD
jgi:hypothetical protein